MMKEKIDKGKIIIRKSKKGKWIFEVDLGGKHPMAIPSFYHLKDDSLNGKECEVIREKGQIKKIFVEGKELQRKQENSRKKDFKRHEYRYNGQNYYNIKQNKKNIMKNKFDVNKTKTPKDVKEKLSGIQKIENFNLLLNKFALFDEDKFLFYKKDSYKIDRKFYYFDFEDFSKNYREKLKNLRLKIKNCRFYPDWRLIVGLGHPSVYETSITLHHIYGIPYIPGSAIKGIARSYFIQREFEKIEVEWRQINIFEKILENLDLEKDKKLDSEVFKKKFSIKERMASEELYKYFYEDFFLKENAKALIKRFQIMFGTQLQQGNIVFFDAYPEAEPKIEVDVMNPHYSDYYGGEKPPADYLDPKPIYFLTVEDTNFEFFIGCKKNIDDSYLTDAENLLKKSLTNYGIGAKTATGYGYMKEI